MKLSSPMAPVFFIVVLASAVFLILTSLISNWCITSREVENGAKFVSQYVHKETLVNIETMTKFIVPASTSTFNLAGVLRSSLNATQPSLSTTETKVAPRLFLALKTLHLSQISYIGSDGSIYSYYIEGNRTLVLYSNTTNTTTRMDTNNGSIIYNCYIQEVDNDAGERYENVKLMNSQISVDPTWLQKVMSSDLNGYASLGRGWGKNQEHMFLNTMAMDGLGAVSLGFPVKAFSDAISKVDLHGGELYLATRDGLILTQTGPLSVKINNNIVSILATRQKIDISCEPNDEPLRRKNVNIRGKSYTVYCKPLDIAGVPSVSLMVYPHDGLVDVVHRHSRIALVLLIVLLASLVITIFSFIFLVIKTARREMFLCAALIKQMEATQQAERKSMNKSLAFASASHDVRSSLAALDGLITLCSIEVDPNSEIYVNLEQMRTFTADLVGLLNSVLDTSKIEAGKMQLMEQEFYLAQVLEESVNLYYPIAKDKGVDLVLDPCDGSVVKHSLVKGDRGKIKQVLNNLLHNAIKFTSDGHIVVRAWVKKQRPESSILASKNFGVWSYFSRFLYKNNETYNDLSSLQAAQQNQNYVEFVIEVDDTGKGIPKEKQKTVFEDFVQVKETALEHEGTGLGLGIVQSLVRLMGGDIGIMDKDFRERGTCFRFNIFLSNCEVASVAEGDRTPGELNRTLELNIRNSSPKSESSYVVFFVQEGERRRMLKKFLQRIGVKVSVTDRLEHLCPVLERLKRKWNLSHLSSSGKSDFGSPSDSLSTPVSRDFNVGIQDVCLNVRDGTDYPLSLHRKTSSIRFALIIVDFNDAHSSDDQFSELYSILENFKNDVSESQCKVVWLYTPQINIEARRLDEKRLAKCDLIVSKPLHGSRLYTLLKLLPEFGGCTTIQGYRPSFSGEFAQPSEDRGESGNHNASHPHCEIQEVGPRSSTPPSNDKLLAGKKVLVADDNLYLRKVAIVLLGRHGAIVEYCENGEEVLNKVRNALREREQWSSRLPYDFIFMDCQMPKMDGYEATRQIRVEEKLYNIRIPIIALTAAYPEEHTKILLAGVDKVITKPLNQDNLHEAIHYFNKSNENI